MLFFKKKQLSFIKKERYTGPCPQKMWQTTFKVIAYMNSATQIGNPADCFLMGWAEFYIVIVPVHKIQ